MVETIVDAGLIEDADDASLTEDASLVAEAGRITDVKLLKPDLVIKFRNITAPTIFPEEKGKVQVTVTNQGLGRISKGSFDINLYASTDSVLDKNPLDRLGDPSRGPKDILQGTDELLGTLRLKNVNLKLGQSKTFTLDFAKSDFRTPSVVSPGSYYLIAEVDPKNTIAERNENNNVASKDISTPGTNVVLDWNATLLNAIQASGKGADLRGTAPPIAARNQAIVHAAIYDAVNAIDRSHKSYLVNIDASDSRIKGASAEAAAVEAGYQTLVALFSDPKLYPDQKLRDTLKATFDEQRTRSLAEIPDGKAEDKGIALGKFVAQQILQARSTDGADQAQIPYTPGNDPGDWRPTPPDFTPALLPGWGRVTPFAIPSRPEDPKSRLSQFGVNGPPKFGSPEYAKEIEEVRKKGGFEDTKVTKITRTKEETEIAQFWAYDRDDTFRPPGQWNEIAQEVALAKHNTLNLEETARLFALLNIAEADAGILAWDAKYTYNQLRPITAIRQEVQSPGAVRDPDWKPLLSLHNVRDFPDFPLTPPFPDYISGHSIFGAAAGKILANLLGDNVSFDIPSQDLPGVSRSYKSFSEAADEDGFSRLYGGIHVRSSIVDGLTAGRNVADYVFNNILT
jgi:hypothetical protein